MVFFVTVVNKSGKTFDPGLFYATMQSGNTEAQQIIDFESGLKGGPTTKLLHGREAKFKIGFNVADAKDLVLEVKPSWEHESTIYTS